jgi:3' terminal RNA ribose 2'-O-methyltransferase Hen1
MLFTITTTHTPATDLGYLLHKHPSRAQIFPLAFGQAHVFYPEAAEARCTAALLLDVDPIALVRGRHGKQGAESGLLTQYINDRPYVASSFLSVAIARVFGAALAGRSTERPDLVAQALPLRVCLVPLPCQGGEALLQRLFAPLGYTVSATGHPLDAQYPDWGQSCYLTVTLEGHCRLAKLLTHLYVLIPVLDDEKHYWVGDAEVDKLLRHGAGWLAQHPEKETIAHRYLKYQRRLAREVLARLADDDDPDPDMSRTQQADAEIALERPLSLQQLRMAAVVQALLESGARRVLDLGCGEGHLVRDLLRHRQFDEIVGLDASVRALDIAQARLKLDRLAPQQRQRLHFLHGALTYRDARLSGYDAAAVVEVIEHLDRDRLATFARVLFGCTRPRTVVVTTPNREYNVKFPSLPAGRLRHRDHRFEWTRQEFQTWACRVAEQYGYHVHFQAIGEDDPTLGPPTQMGVFTCS